MLYWYNWFSWWWARGCSKHVENWNKYIERIVRQFGRLPRSNEPSYVKSVTRRFALMCGPGERVEAPKVCSDHSHCKAPSTRISALMLKRRWSVRNVMRQCRSASQFLCCMQLVHNIPGWTRVTGHNETRGRLHANPRTVSLFIGRLMHLIL